MTTTSWAQMIAEAQAGGGIDPVPPNTYTVQIADAEAKTASTGRSMIRTEFHIADGGAHNGRKVWNNFVIVPENPNALAIFFRQMKAIGLDEAFFATEPSMEQIAEAMKGRMAQIKVGIRTYEGTQRNEVDNMSAPPAGAAAPQPGVPVVQHAAPAPAPAAAAPAPAQAPAPAPAPAQEQPPFDVPQPAPAAAPQPPV